MFENFIMWHAPYFQITSRLVIFVPSAVMLIHCIVHDRSLLEASKEDTQAKKVYQKSNKQFVSLVHKQEQLLRGLCVTFYEVIL